MLSAKQLTIQVGNKTICRDFSFQLQPGQIWGVLGPNGSGKTTLLHALAGHHPVTAGTIYLDDTAQKQLSRKRMAKQLGILFQDINPSFQQSVHDYCLGGRYPHSSYFHRNHEKDALIVQQVLEKIELADQAQQCISTLSGGEMRRLAIATLLAQAPSIYLLDEPTNHLDIRHQSLVLRYFRSLTKERTAAVMLSLHDVNQAQQFCDHILLLYPDGEIAQGPTHQLLTADNLSKLYCHPMKMLTADDNLYWMPYHRPSNHCT